MNGYQQFLNPSIDDNISYASVFIGNFSVLLSILIGIVASILVLRAAKRMGGGLFGSVLNYIGSGMVLIVFATISVVGGGSFLGVWSDLASTVFFVTGYIFMVLGANKLFKGIMNT